MKVPTKRNETWCQDVPTGIEPRSGHRDAGCSLDVWDGHWCRAPGEEHDRGECPEGKKAPPKDKPVEFQHTLFVKPSVRGEYSQGEYARLSRGFVEEGPRMGVKKLWRLAFLVGGSLLLLMPPDARGFGDQVVPRDAFPVFDNPKMLSAAEAEARGVIFERDMVIGVARGGEAKAYPITIMGVHELGNDTIGGVPIAVSW